MRWRSLRGAHDNAAQPELKAAAEAAIADHRAAPLASRAGAERVVRALARLGAAAGRHRPCHHLRRHGRHQHGAWRDGDARRLHHLRGAGGVPHHGAGLRSTGRCRSPYRSPSSSRPWSASRIERGIIRFLYGRPLETLLATWGVSLILQQAVRTIFGPTNREVGTPGLHVGRLRRLRHLTITWPAVDHRLHAWWCSSRCFWCCSRRRRSACRCAR